MSASDAIRHQLEVSERWQDEIQATGLQTQVKALEAFQKERLGDTYADLAQLPRYAMATEFFVTDLYAPDNLHERNQQMRRMLPVMFRLLPPSVLDTVALALTTQSQAQMLDYRTARALRLAHPKEKITDAHYAEAYRESAEPGEREEQIEHIVAVGESLQELVELPMIYQTLKMCRWPARVAGLSDLQQFLENGFEAFHEMQGAEEFLDVIKRREKKVLEQLLGGAEEPFALPAQVYRADH
ncbi:MAG: hypothetical protein AAGA23_22190 [Pseudomonadota bacterium]